MTTECDRLSLDFIPKSDARFGHSLTGERSPATVEVCSCGRSRSASGSSTSLTCDAQEFHQAALRNARLLHSARPTSDASVSSS